GGAPMRLEVDLSPAYTDARLSQGEARLRLRRNAATPDATRLDLACVPVSWARSLLARSEEHTSELQSRENLVCRLLLEKTHAPLRAASGPPAATAMYTLSLHDALPTLAARRCGWKWTCRRRIPTPACRRAKRACACGATPPRPTRPGWTWRACRCPGRGRCW